jgi:hypothetical protein
VVPRSGLGSRSIQQSVAAKAEDDDVGKGCVSVFTTEVGAKVDGQPAVWVGDLGPSAVLAAVTRIFLCLLLEPGPVGGGAACRLLLRCPA